MKVDEEISNQCRVDQPSLYLEEDGDSYHIADAEERQRLQGGQQHLQHPDHSQREEELHRVEVQELEVQCYRFAEVEANVLLRQKMNNMSQLLRCCFFLA